MKSAQHDSPRRRIISNYVRLFVTFSSGLLIVRLLAEIGPSVLVAYLLLMAGTGFAHFGKIVIQETVVPILGLSYEEKLGRSFRGMYWLAFLVSILAAALAVFVFVIFWLLLPYFDIGTVGVTAFSAALAFVGARTVVAVLATPALNAVLVSGRFVAYNVFLALGRLADLAAAVVVFLLWIGYSENTKAVIFFAIAAGLYIAVQVACFVYATSLDNKFFPKKAPIKPQDWRWVRGIFGWNLAAVVAFILYLRANTLLINASYGQGATLLIGVVFMLIGYQQQIAMGLVVGLDAVVARIYGKGESAATSSAIAVLMQSTYLQGVFSFLSVTVLWIFVEPILRLWLGSSLSGSGWDYTQAATLFRIMSLGVLARSLSENWMKILNGKGRVSTYAPFLLFGGIINCIVVIWLTLLSGFHAQQALLVLALVFTSLYVIVHIVIVPWRLCREIPFRINDLVRVLSVPSFIALVIFVGFDLILQVQQSLPLSILCLVILGIVGVLLILPQTIAIVAGRVKPSLYPGNS